MRILHGVALVCAGALAACSSTGPTQSVALKATPASAVCDVQQNGSVVASGVSANAQIKVGSADAPLAISCAAPGFETLTTEIVAAAFQKSRSPGSGISEVRVNLKPVSNQANLQVDCAVAGLSLKMSERDCQNMSGAQVARYYEVPLVQAASLEWSGVMPPNWKATGKPLSILELAN